MKTADPSELKCLLCSSAALDLSFDGRHLMSVTSDTKPWNWPAMTYFCRDCGHLQKQRSNDAQREVENIYSNYEIYQLSNGLEQVIFQNGNQVPTTRSFQLIARLVETIDLPRDGQLLDIGCGNGAFLSAFGKQFKRWRLSGFEQNSRYQGTVSKFSGVQRFYSASLEAINHKFDLITLIHVLEHVDTPVDFLKQIRPLLKESGLLLIQLPNVIENPLDMIVIDHYSHFSPDVLRRFVLGLGYELVFTSTDWVRKEITLGVSLAKGVRRTTVPEVNVPSLANFYSESSEWLHAFLEAAKNHDENSRLGVFGTAVAGTWLAANLGSRIDFFVDEDLERAGKLHLGKRVIHPREVLSTDSVLLAFPYSLARRIQDRILKSYVGAYILPPPFYGMGDVLGDAQVALGIPG